MKNLFFISHFSILISHTLLAAESAKLVPVILEQSISRSQVYPQQPVELSVSLYVEETPKNTTGLDPFTRATSHQRGHAPVLSLPWAEDQKIPKPLYPAEPRELWVASLPQNRVGFALPGAATTVNYDLSVPLFFPVPEKVLRKNDQGKEILYWKYTLQRRLVPTVSDKITIPPARFWGIMLGTALDSDSQPVPRPVAVSVESKPVRLTILDVPKENRPKNDVGLFGLFDWSVDLIPTTAKVGEPLTLTITFRGVGSIAHAKAPDLTQNPRITEHFKTYPATEEKGEDFYRFIYAVRPKTSGNIVFPEMTVSYFNVDQERFLELKSRPIAAAISEAEQVEVSAITQGREALAPKWNEPVLTESGIFANLTGPGDGQNQRVCPVFYFSLFGALGVTYLAVAVGAFLFGLQKKVFRSNSPRALTIERARNRFTDLPELLAADKPYEACVQVQNTLVDFVSQIAPGTVAGITPTEVVGIARTWGLPEMQLEELGDLFDHLDAIRFGALPPQQVAQLVERGTAILEDLIAAIPAPGGLKSKDHSAQAGKTG